MCWGLWTHWRITCSQFVTSSDSAYNDGMAMKQRLNEPYNLSSQSARSKQAYNKFKMADRRHLEKLKTAISPQRFDRSAQNLAWWRILAFRGVWAVKNFQLLKIQDGGRPPSWKNQKRPYLRNALTDLHNIWQEGAFGAFWTSKGYGQLKFPTFKNPRWRTAAILKNRKRPYPRNGLTDLHEIWHSDANWHCKAYWQLEFQTSENPPPSPLLPSIHPFPSLSSFLFTPIQGRF